jgi:glutamate synthase (NADPH/NADH) large chain
MNIQEKLILSYQKKIINNFNEEIENFIQVCPKEMLDKLSNPITLKKNY